MGDALAMLPAVREIVHPLLPDGYLTNENIGYLLWLCPHCLTLKSLVPGKLWTCCGYKAHCNINIFNPKHCFEGGGIQEYFTLILQNTKRRMEAKAARLGRLEALLLERNDG